MPKHDFLTPKAIANRMKSKGLQKLRWYCQVCQKQCRDENGFKCHTQSESHQRQMLIVAKNPDKFISGYSEQFEYVFLENLRRRHGTKRIRANAAYNEYISDKTHIHMNATQWTTLSSFVQYLGRAGKCMVDETEKGWYIAYIDRDPRKLARQEELARKRKNDLDHEDRNRNFIKKQLKIARMADTNTNDIQPTKLQRTDDSGMIRLDISLGGKLKKAALHVTSGPFGVSSEKDKLSKAVEKPDLLDDSVGKSQHMSEALAKAGSASENWICEGIVVKVMNKELQNGKFYKKKGVITHVEQEFCATIEMIESKDVLQLDQDDLETVIPQVGKKVMVLNGEERGQVAEIVSISLENYNAVLRILDGPKRGEVFEDMEYEDFSRLALE